MNAIVLFASLAALLSLPVAASAQPCPLFTFQGLDYRTGPGGAADPTPGTYLDPGDWYELVGVITAFSQEFTAGPVSPPANMATHQYTVHLSGFEVVSTSMFAGFLVVTFSEHGRFRVYADPYSGGTPGVYGTDPRNATVPSTFTDGDGSGMLVLGGEILLLDFVYDFNSGTGGWSSSGVVFDEGAWVPGLLSLGDDGLSLGAQLGSAGPEVPAGFDAPVQGQAGDCGVPVTSSTWGALKSLYR